MSVLFGMFGIFALASGLFVMVLASFGAAKTAGSTWLVWLLGPIFVLVGICLLWTEHAEIDLRRQVITSYDSFFFITTRRRNSPLPAQFRITLALWHESGRRGRVPHAKVTLDTGVICHTLFDGVADHALASKAAGQLSSRVGAPLALTCSRPNI